MTLRPLLAVFLTLCTLSACASTPEDGEIHNVRFALRDENIESWQETGDGFAIQLSNEGQRKIHQLTRDNHDRQMEIYAGRILLSSSTIHQTLHGESVFVEADDDIKDRVVAFLPAAKREN